jgi:hypothetical protein
MVEWVLFGVFCAFAFLAFCLALLLIATFAAGASLVVKMCTHVFGWECHITEERKSVERAREFLRREVDSSA